uniref:Uncharacterized protein n=1 Tax=Anguilla anguilla TaxID=7936 RepID=A0A0E9R188_ANGAN
MATTLDSPLIFLLLFIINRPMRTTKP